MEQIALHTCDWLITPTSNMNASILNSYCKLINKAYNEFSSSCTFNMKEFVIQCVTASTLPTQVILALADTSQHETNRKPNTHV